jgi:hypothetical protein
MPLPLHHIRPVDSRGRHTDQHFAGSRLRHRPHRQAQLLGPPGRGDLNDFHVHVEGAL